MQSGWYSHWSPAPSELACIDQGPDRGVRMYAWSDRGNNYPYNNVIDADRLGMRVKYGSDDSPVCTVRIQPGTLQFNNTGGPIGVWDKDDNYPDDSFQLQYTLSYVGPYTPTYNLTDSDGDGLPDYVETHGFMDLQGNIHYTDPNNDDTDGDGLTDGEEVGTWTNVNGLNYLNFISDPTKVDSDNDGISDADELDIGTNPMVSDTDGDGMPDGRELLKYYTDPTAQDTDGDGPSDAYEIYNGQIGGYPINQYPNPNPEPLPPDYPGRVKYDISPAYPYGDSLVYEKRSYTPAEMYSEYKLGMRYGDASNDIGDHLDHNNMYYLLGHMASSVLVYGDYNDAKYDWNHQDYVNCGINGISLLLDMDMATDAGKAICKGIAKGAAEIDAKMFFIDLAKKFEESTPEKSVEILNKNIDDDTLTTLTKTGDASKNKFTDEELVGLIKDHKVNIVYLRLIMDDSDAMKECPDFVKYVKYVYEDSGNADLQAWLTKRIDGMGSQEAEINAEKELGETVDPSLLKSKAGYLANIKGGYGEYLAYTDLVKTYSVENGYPVVVGLVMKVPTAPGPDFIFKVTDSYGNTFVKVVEVKARKSLSIKDLTNYIMKNSKNYNIKYVVSHEGEAYFMDASGKGLPIQLDVYIYGDNSVDLANNIISQLPSDKILQYSYKKKVDQINYITFDGQTIVNVIPGSLGSR